VANGIVWTENTLSRNLETFGPKLNLALKGFFEFQESRVQDYARSNAPWKDQTGNARQGLFAKAFAGEGSYGVDVYHTMPYGIWLEVKNNGQYAVIVPTIQAEGRRIMGELGKLLDMMRAVA